MRLFDTPGADLAYDSWLTTNPYDNAHVYECNCIDCHENHDIRENHDDKDFKCCIDEFQSKLISGDICKKYPIEHYDIYMKGDFAGSNFILANPKICLECNPDD